MEHSTDPLNLHPHELNAAVYGADDLPGEFLDSVREFGVLTPLVVLEDYTIISGHRRWLAAKQLGQCSVPIRVVLMTDELDIAQAIIEANRQRDKTFSQKMREAEVLRKIETERARLRMEAGVKPDPVATCPQGKSRDAVAEQVGLGSGRTYDRAKTVWDKSQSGDKAAVLLVKRIDADETTIGAAYRELRVSAAEVPPVPDMASGSWRTDTTEGALDWWEHYPALKALRKTLDELPQAIMSEREAIEAVLWLGETAQQVRDSW